MPDHLDPDDITAARVPAGRATAVRYLAGSYGRAGSGGLYQALKTSKRVFILALPRLSETLVGLCGGVATETETS